MSLQSTVSNRLEQSGKRLNSLGNLANHLLGDVWLCMEKHSVDPVHQTEFALLSASTILQQASDTSLTDSEAFLTFTSEHIRNKIFEIVGRSPGFLDDIIGEFQNLAQEGIDHSQDFYDDLIDVTQETAQTQIDSVQNDYDDLVGHTQEVAQDSIDWTQDVVDEGIKLTQDLAGGILDGIISLGSILLEGGTALFGFLGSILSGLFSFEINDVLKLQEDMTDAYSKQQSEKLKNSLKGR